MSTPGGGLRRSRSGQAPDDRAAGSAGPAGSGRGLLSAGWVGLLGVVLAAAAASVVVLSDDARWLRLGVVAALWAALLAVAVLLRRGASHESDAEAEAERLRLAYESELSELESVLAAQREYEEILEHDLRREVAREVEERHSDEISGLRAEVERLQAHVEARDAHQAAPVAVPARPPLETEVLAPQQRMTALDSGPGARAVAGAAGQGHRAADRAPARAAASMPVPPTVPPPPARVPWPALAPPAAPPAPAPPVPTAPAPPARGSIARPDPRTPASVADRAPVARLPHPPPERAPVGPPGRSPSVLDRGSFVDQYVRSTGHDPGPWREAPVEASAPEVTSGVPSTTTGRTVAELLAAHSAATRGTPRPHRRPEG